MKVNFVMSSYKRSSIFDAIIGYFKEHSDIKIIITNQPVSFGIDAYFYFRPHLSTKIYPNSIITVHHDLTDETYDNESFVRQYRQAGMIVCLNSTQQNILSGYGILNTVLIPHGFHPLFDKVLSNKNKFNGKLTLGFVSKRYNRGVKGEARLLSLYKHLDPKKFEFIFIGEGREDTTYQAKLCGMDAKYILTENYCHLVSKYKLMDALVILSENEGGPASLQEGLASGIPIIATSVGAVPDFINNNKNGIILDKIVDDKKRFEDLYNHFESLSANAAEYNRELSNLLSWEQNISSYISLFEQVRTKRIVLPNPIEISIKTKLYNTKKAK